MRYAKIANYDTANGKGLRTTLYVQGCPHHCKGCFNPETWDFDKGKEFTDMTKSLIFELLDKPGIRGLSVLGGEPLAQGQDIVNLLKEVKERYPNKDIWMWTGYIYEHMPFSLKNICSYVDVLVDGPFIEDLKNIKLNFMGSENQRIIDIKKTLETNTVTLLEE